MIPKTPRGFRDVLPTEAAWRMSMREAINKRFKLWGYLPIETPAIELLDVIEMDGKLSNMPFRFFDSDNKLLVLRPDGTLPVARMTALRLKEKPRPLRLCYAQHVFTENDSTYGDERQVMQIGIELIGKDGYAADAEVICLLFEALEAVQLTDFTVVIGTVGVLNALVKKASDDQRWHEQIFAAFHACDYVAIDRLVADCHTDPKYAEAIAKIARIRGQREAICACRDLVAPLGCEDGLDDLERTFDLICDNIDTGKLMIDFSIVSSFDYYTGIVFRAFAAQVPTSIANGGRYDNTLKSFGSAEPAAGFAICVEQLMQALERQHVRPPRTGPDAVIDAADAALMFTRARKMRAQGKRVALGDVMK